MVDYAAGVNAHKQAAGTDGSGGGGNFGVAPLSSHMGRAAEMPQTSPAQLGDGQRAHKGYHKRKPRDTDVDHGPVNFGR